MESGMMKPPVRIVCRGCLRSVEIDEEARPTPTGSCPYCGQVLDSRQGADGGPTEEPEASTSMGDGQAEREATSEWIATWTRGSLGVLNRFQLRDRLGDGGFGEVYLAYDPRLDRDVALKVLRQANPSDRVMERFFREARAAARLDHPNIVAVYDSGFDRGRCWVAYQYVSGRPLWWFFDHQPVSPADAARLIRDLADAVDYAHRHGVVHRDIKPANILIDDRMRPRLIDFGLARRADLDSSLTRDGAVIGTPAYMSPEQALGHSRQVDERSDVFSLGVVLFEALAGRRPRSATTIRTPPNGPPRAEASSAEDWGDVDPAVPPGLVRICKRATADRPEDRYPTARAFADDLDAWLRGRERPADRGARPSRLLAAASALALVAASLLLGFLAGDRLAASRARGTVAPAALLKDAGVSAEKGGPPAAPQPPAATPKRVASKAEDGLVSTVKGEVFHQAGCWAARPIAAENRVHLASPKEAIARGLRPCKHCLDADGKPLSGRGGAKS